MAQLQTIHDSELGSLEEDPKLPGTLVTNLSVGGHSVTLHLVPDDGEIEECVQLAKALVKSFAEVEIKARRVAGEKLLGRYNENWRMFSRINKGGQWEDVTNPELTLGAFADRLHLQAIEVSPATIEFCFGDDNLFAGHAIFVTSFDGLGFTDADASLFG